MKSLWLLTKKNLKLLIRSKSSALIIFFAPLLIILILGLSYNNSSKYGLNIGVYAGSFTEDVNSVVASLQEKEFKIIKYETSIEECVEDIKLGFVHTCVSLPENFQIEENKPKEIVFYIDPSRINLVGTIQETLDDKFNLKSQQISENLAGNIITQLDQTKVAVGEKSSELNSIKEKSSAVSSSVQTISSNLAEMDLSIAASSYDKTIVSTFQKNLSATIEKSMAEIKKAVNAVEDANISSGKSSITAALNDADSSLDKAFALINGSSSTSFQGITLLISSLEAELKASKTKLSSAAETISSTSSSLDSTTKTIQETVIALESVQKGLNSIKSNLESQKVTEARVISAPLTIKVETAGKQGTHLNYMFPALLVLVVMFSSLLLGTTLVMMEKNSPAFFRNFFVPLQKGFFVISIYFTNIIITLVQILIILGVSLVFLDESLSTMLLVSVILLISSTVFTFLGIGIGYLFKSEETGTLASISLGSFLLFMSGVILPLESVSPGLRKITYFNPFVISEKIIRELLIFTSSIKIIWIDVLTLISYSLALFLIILIVEIALQRHLIDHFMKHHHKAHQQKDKVNNNDV